MEETHELRLRRQELIIEYENIEKYTLERLADGHFLGIVFRGLDPQLYSSVFPLMNNRENPIIGTVCLSAEWLPGMDGMITKEQLDEIIAAGWDTALYYDGDGELEDFLSQMRTTLSGMGIDMPKTVLFESKAYSESVDLVLAANGIKFALHHGEGNKLLIEDDVSGKVWQPGALAWNTKGFSSSMLSEIVSKGGIGYFEVAFEGTFQLLYDEKENQRTAAFTRMLEVIESFIVKEKLVSTGIDEAYNMRCEYLSKKEDLLVEIAVRKEEINLEIAEIDKEISAIYKKHHYE